MPYKQSGYGAFGNYSNTGVDTPYNYFAEQSTPSDQLSYNDYFVFNLTGITAPITSATLTLFSYDDTTNNSFRVGGYTGSIKKLLDGTGGTTAYTALGSGKLYGLQTFTVADSNHYVTFNLNAAFIKAINKAIEAGDKEFVLGGSAGTATPEPATWALMMVGLGGVGAAMRRARRRVGEARA